MKKILALLLALSMFAGAVLAEEVVGPDETAPVVTSEPTAEPTAAPTAETTAEPTAAPADESTPAPTEIPTDVPTNAPTAEPVDEPTAEPTEAPAEEPTVEPTDEPAGAPTVDPTAEPSAEPTAEPTPIPSEEPDADPTIEPTEAPDGEPTAEPSVEPTTEPTEEATPAPSEEPGAEPTAEPTEDPSVSPTTEPTPEASEEPTAEPTPEPAPEATATPSPADGPLYVMVDGVKLYGKPDVLILMGTTIYLYNRDVIELVGYTAEVLAEVEFALDPEVFTAKDDCIYLSVRDPNGFVKQDTFFLWAGKKGDMATATPLPPVQEEVVEHEILVSTVDYSASEPCRPTFILSAAPEMEAGMHFAVIVDGNAPQPLSGDRYSPQSSGTYRFALLAADGSVLHRSSKYSVQLLEPTPDPTAEPTPEPTAEPTEEPTPAPTAEPTEEPTPAPTAEPTEEPTPAPTAEPTEEPTPEPTAEPTEEPTPAPTAEPTEEPTPEPTAEPTEEPTPDPTAEPTEEPTPAPTAEPTEEPTPEPTAEPTEEPTPAPTAEQTEEPTLDPTAEPTEESTPDPTVEPTEEPTPEPVSSAQAWTLDGEVRVEGNLAELLQSNSDVIYILTSRIIVLDGGNAQLSGKILLPDPEWFGEDYVVRISGENEDVERDDSLFVWVERKGEATETVVTLQVAADGYVEGAWCSIVPSFELTADPALDALEDGYAFAVSINGGAPILLTSSVYPAVEEGRYTLQFHLLAPDGSMADSSGSYVIWADYTAPLLQIRTGNGSMQITVGDALSGGSAVSLDGGVTWNDLTIGEDGVATYAYTAETTETFPQGMILVRDQAGCVTVYPSDVTVRKMSFNRGGSSRNPSHSASTEDSVTAYDGVELILDDGSMSQLTFGEETLDLHLTYTGENPLPDGVQPAFTAAFADLTEAGVKDMLILTAAGVSDEAAGDYAWSFTGLVCKKLSASGIDYLMLRAGSQVTLLTTAGFTAGLRYNMYRAEGLVSKDFLYALSMDAENGLAMTVTVADATYPMSGDPTDEMYYYDLFSGNIEELDETVRMIRDEVMQ